MPKKTNSPIHDQLLDRRSKLEQVLESSPDDQQIQRLLGEVDAAIGRLDKGTYGLCESCHEPIAPERLIADPLANYCLDCLTPGQRQALEKDLELATQIQTALLPPQNLGSAGWATAYYYRGAGPISGDYCDLLISGDDLYFIVGDVSGKGVAASMLMAHLHATFRALVSLRLPMDQLPLNQVMERASRMFCESTLPTHFATLVCGKASHSGQIEVCNAGHHPPLLVQGSTISSLKATGLPLGMFSDEHFTVSSVQLAPGDTVLLYTDGLSEAVDSSGQEYGTERLCGILKAQGFLSPEELISVCLEDLKVFCSGVPKADDVTIMAIRRLGKGN